MAIRHNRNIQKVVSINELRSSPTYLQDKSLYITSKFAHTKKDAIERYNLCKFSEVVE